MIGFCVIWFLGIMFRSFLDLMQVRDHKWRLRKREAVMNAKLRDWNLNIGKEVLVTIKSGPDACWLEVLADSPA